ncbi:MauE/DoxX family redox-associated membrane protein [Nocardia sp. NPDC051570]|uniref:MauE/DoxX family redox-associated membrane protein n=1 Tax=Nocardia sp. NPDC051570 TaxID=3364324 RepID=UPI0037BC477B
MSVVLTCVAVAARAAIGVVFVLATVSKLGHTARIEFRAAVTGLVPAARNRSAALLATTVIATEWGIVVVLAIPDPVTTVAGFGLAATTLGAFTTAITAGIRRGTTTGCRCFGTSTHPVSRIQLARNLVLLAVTLTGLTAAALTLALPAGATVSAAGLWVAAGTGAVLGAVLTSFDELAELFTPTPPSTTPHTATTRRSAVTGQKKRLQ